MDITTQVTLGTEPEDVTLDTPAGPITVTVVPFNGPGIYTVSGHFLMRDDGDAWLSVSLFPPIEWDTTPEFPTSGGSEHLWTAPRDAWYALG